MEEQIITTKPKRTYLEIFAIVMLILIVLGVSAYGVLYVKSYYQNQAYQVGLNVGAEQVIALQNQNAQWYYMVGNATDYTIQNVSIIDLCGSLK